ncbi:MAG: class I SAM-dependent methyltransferase [Lachnospiraceae bacterium]|nr:class I SAM-dependent methyltransferase [Lachnospiraceae bacterium]
MNKENEIKHWTTKKTMDYHENQFIQPKRSTVAFEKFLSSKTDISGNVLDLACGGGAVDAYIASMHKDVTITGVDLIGSSFQLFDKYVNSDLRNRIILETGDWYNLDKKYIEAFDGVISVQTLSWLEKWKDPIDKIIELNPRWMAFSSLFYEGRIELQIKAMDYERCNEIGDHEETFYNIYSIPIIKEYLESKGYSVFEYAPFEIDIDLPKPKHKDFETYTVKTDEGKRLQISAAMLMPWYFIYAAKE